MSFDNFENIKNDNLKVDIYWDFDKSQHYRPKLNKGDFFLLNDFDFGWYILEPLTKFIGKLEQEIELSKFLSYGQKALYFWWYLDAQVTNGGFVQFYENGYEKYIPTIIKGLEYIGDKKMLELVNNANKIYQKNKELILKNPNNKLTENHINVVLDKFSLLDYQYFKLNNKTIKILEKYIRKKPNEFCLDEDGKEFNSKYSGECKNYHKNGLIKELFTLEKGLINGEYKGFYENGTIKEIINFLKGKKTGETTEYYENGKISYSIKILYEKNVFEHISYHENGVTRKLEHKLIDKDERFGEYKEWYDNGQLAEKGTYISNYNPNGEWLEFYQNGNKKLFGEYKDGEIYIAESWLENGEQTIINGNGFRVLEDSNCEGKEIRYQNEYKNFVKHGKQLCYINGIISTYQEMEFGKLTGITREYYKNGKLKVEKQFKENELLFKKEYPLFENPKVITEIDCKMEDEWIINRNLETADSYPKPINTFEISSSFYAPIHIFKQRSQDSVISCSFFVSIDKFGNVMKTEFLSSERGDIISDVENSIKKLKFISAKKAKMDINSYLIIEYILSLDET